MKQIHKAVQALESDIEFWRPSWILLENSEKYHRANFLWPICILEIFRNNPSRGVWLYYQILMAKTEISAKILKNLFLLSESRQKLFSSRPGWGFSFKPNMKQIPQGQYAYSKYLEIIWVRVFEWEQKQNAAAAGGLSKNNLSLHHHITGGDLGKMCLTSSIIKWHVLF